MSAKESGGLLDQLPIDRLRTEVTELGKAMAKNGFSSAVEKVGDASGPAGKAAKSIKDGESPVKAATKAGTSALKDKVKEAVGGGGGGKKMKVVNILETIDVPVPRRVAYDKWTQFQDIPDFTRKVEKVDQKEDEKLEWKAQVFLSHRTWQATIKEQVPDERIVWESSGEKGHVDGAVTFHELAPDLTRVLMTLEYHPQGFFEKTANLWRAQGRRARADMRQFRREMTMHTMLEQEEQEGWRGEIRDKEVVKSDEEGQKEEKQKKSSSSDGRSTSKKSASGNGNARKSTAKKSTAKKSSSSSSSPRKSAAKKSSSSTRPRKSAAKKSSSSSSSRRSPAKKTAAARKSTGKKTASARPAKKSASKRTAKKASRSSS
ncbi:MAG TPA: SRPBCC family protein [Nocardioides sp.]|nr:SRPBCC family protein [Nocardioides sp.]